MILRSISLISLGAYLIGIRPGLIRSRNVIELEDNSKLSYDNIICNDWVILSTISYDIRSKSRIPDYTKYKISFRPCVVYHNGNVIHRDILLK